MKIILIPLLLACSLPSWGAFTLCKKIEIDNTKVGSSTHLNFPVGVIGTYSYLAVTGSGGSVTDPQGDDVVFYPSASGGCTGTKLDHEVERWISTTGEVVYWVRVPSVSHSAPTDFYMGVGDASITSDQSNPTGVWDSRFKGVYPLKDGTSLNLNTSVSGGTNGTGVNTPTPVTGKIDGGMGLASASTQYVTAGNTPTNPTEITYSVWVNFASFPGSYNSVITKNDGAGHFYDLHVKSNGKLALYVSAPSLTSYDGTGSATLATGTWYHIALTYSDSDGLRGYVNGVQDGTAASGGGASVPGTLNIGRDAFFAGREVNGSIDEVRPSDIVRPASWILAEYNNMSSPSTFYTITDATAPGATRGYGQIY